MLLLCLQDSIGNESYSLLAGNREAYMVDGVEVGIKFVKRILSQSKVDTTADPEVIRQELTASDLKFQSLGYDIRPFNQWVQLKMNQLAAKGQTSTDIRAHLLKAYMSSNDDKFTSYISLMKDRIRDNPTEEFTYVTLMDRALSKYDSIQTELAFKNAAKGATEDPLLTLEAQIKNQNKTIAKLHKQINGGGGGGKAKKDGDGGGKSKKKRKGKKEWKPFPKELKSKPAPADPTKPLTIDGVDYYYCTKHEKWGRHSSAECTSKGIDKDKDKSPGNRAGKTVRALAAIPS